MVKHSDDAMVIQNESSSSDYLEMLFGIGAAAQDLAPVSLNLATALRPMRAHDWGIIKDAIEAEGVRAKAQCVDWSGRVYKTNKAQIELHGDGPGKQASMSVGGINESRRRRAVQALTVELQEQDELLRSMATEDGAQRVTQRFLNLYVTATKAVDSGRAVFKTVDAQFEYMLLDSLNVRGLSGQGSVTSNGLSQAILAAIKVVHAQDDPHGQSYERQRG
jgi:hypothetical protein